MLSNFGMRMLIGRMHCQHIVEQFYRLLTTHTDQLLLTHHITAQHSHRTRINKCNQYKLSLRTYCSRMSRDGSTRNKSVPRVLEQTQYLQSLLDDNVQKDKLHYLSVEEWDGIFEGSSDKLRHDNIPLRLFEMLAFSTDADVSLELARSLRDYITKKGIQHSPLALDTGYMVLLSKQQGQSTLDELLAIYDDIRSQYDVLDSKSINELILAIIHTPRWKDCFELLEMIKISASPTPVTYSNIVLGALIHGDFDIAYQMLDIMHKNDMYIYDIVYEAFLANNDMSSVECFLDYLRENGTIPSSKASILMKDWFQRQYGKEYEVKCETFLSKTSDLCPHCKIPLEMLEPIREEEFMAMREAFINRVLYRKGDVYINTTPKELKKFTEFLHQSGPFDVVIDGLNVSYNTKRKVSVRHRAEIVKSVIRYFVKQEMRICVMSKKHVLNSWPRDILDYISNNATCFYTSNISEDDLFMLYAVLHSGLGTYFVTRDELRDHCFLLGPEPGATFKQWQLQHQIVFRGKTDNKLIFRWPPKHRTTIQRTQHGWHIPYEDQELREDFKPPHSWLCLQRLNAKPS